MCKYFISFDPKEKVKKKKAIILATNDYPVDLLDLVSEKQLYLLVVNQNK